MNTGKYRKAMAKFGEEFGSAQAFGKDWYPPEGPYTVSVTDLRDGEYTTDEGVVNWLQPILTIIDGELAGRQFPLSRYTPRNFGAMKGDCKALNAGLEPNSTEEAIDVLERAASEDIVMVVEVEEIISKKTQKPFTVVNITQVLGATGSDDAAETPPAEVEEPVAVPPTD